MSREFYRIVEEICKQDSRYHTDAYEFVMESLTFAQKRFKRQKHVSGKELLEAIKILIVDKFGPMAITVLGSWGIKETKDIGNIVFNLVDRQVLSKDKDDRIESFSNVYDFDQVFLEDYRKQLEKKISRMRTAS